MLLAQHVSAYEQWNLWHTILTTGPNTAAWCSRMQSGELTGTSRWSAVFSQEGLQIGPVLAFAPSKSQTSHPAALCSLIGL